MNSYWVAHSSAQTGVKINGTCYCDVFSDRCCFLTFVQHQEASFSFFSGSAPTHRAKDTVELLDQEMLDFIPPALWLPNLLDLNPVD